MKHMEQSRHQQPMKLGQTTQSAGGLCDEATEQMLVHVVCPNVVKLSVMCSSEQQGYNDNSN